MNIVKKLVIKNLMLNRKRTIVSVIGILLAMALLTALFTLTGSFRTSIIEREKNQSGNYHVMFMNVEADDYEKYKQNRMIANIYTEIDLGYAVLEGSENEYKPYAYVVSFDKESLEQSPFKLYEGRMPENNSEIVISHHTNTNGRVGLKVGDVITLNIGERNALERDGEEGLMDQYYEYGVYGEEAIVNTQEHTYTIVGIVDRASYHVEPYSAPGYTFVTVNDGQTATACIDKLYIEFTQEGLKQCSELTATLLGLDEASDVELFRSFNEVDRGGMHFTEENWQKYCEEVLPKVKYNWEFNTYLIRYQRIWPIDSMFITLFAIAGFVGLIIIATSVYCIKNSFEISVAEKIRLYGLLTSIGATKKQIRKSVLFEAFAEGVMGLPGGIALGLLASFILCKVSNVLLAESFATDNLLVYVVSWQAIAISVLLGIVTIYFSSISAMIKAGRVTPIEAIRNANDIKIKAKKIKAPRIISKLWGIGGVIAYKNIKRNKRKYRTSVVSIAICTITFIVVSYVMSLVFGLVNNIYADERSNITVRLDYIDIKYEEVHKYFKDLDAVKNVSYTGDKYVFVEGVTYTDAYQKLFEDGDGEVAQISEAETFISLWVIDDEAFKDYLKKCKKSVKEGQVVFINYASVYREGIARVYDYLGNKLTAFRTEEGYYDGEGEKKTIELEVGAETDIIPLGLANRNYEPAIVMSNSTFDALGMAELPGLNRNVDAVFFETDKADLLQDSVTTILDENSDVFGEHWYVYNKDQNVREERSLYVLIGIFAYGLIVVIALIGITNIVNTLGTGMELRAKDFATLRSIGMTKLQFRKMVWLESIFTSAKSLIIGVITGIGITLLFWRYECYNDIDILYKPPVGAVLICITVVLLLVYLIISSSLSRINKRNIVETIKNENV